MFVKIWLHVNIFEFPKLTQVRPVHALSCIMGNQGKMEGFSNVCIAFQSQLILSESIYLTLSL